MIEIYIIIVVFFSSCTLVPKIETNSFEKFDKVLIGEPSSSAEKELGKSSEKKINTKLTNIQEWHYNNKDENESQKALVAVNIETNKVVMVQVIPDEIQKEFSLEYLLKEKFSGIEFKEYSVKKCDRDYYPTETFYVNIEKGLVIAYDKHFKYVSSYSREIPSLTQALIERIASCKQ